MERCEIEHVLTNFVNALFCFYFLLFGCAFLLFQKFNFCSYFFCGFSNLSLGPATYCALKCLLVIGGFHVT